MCGCNWSSRGTETVHKLYLLALLYVNTLYLPNPLRRSKRRPCFMIACNFELIQSLCQDLGNVLKRSMAFFSRNIKVTKKCPGSYFGNTDLSKVFMHALYTIE